MEKRIYLDSNTIIYLVENQQLVGRPRPAGPARGGRPQRVGEGAYHTHPVSPV